MRPLCRGEDGNLRSFRELASSSKASHSTRAALAAGAIDCGHCWPVGALMGRFDLGRLCDPRPRLISARLKKAPPSPATIDRKSTRLNSSHTVSSYAVFCLKKKKVSRVFGAGRRHVAAVRLMVSNGHCAAADSVDGEAT